MEPIDSVLANPEGELAPLKKLSEHIFKTGATLSCPKCGRSKDKTAEEMATYMKKWPKCQGTQDAPHEAILADVRLK